MQASKTVNVVPFTRDLKIRNLDALPRGLNAPFLLVIEGEQGEYVAKQWKRKLPNEGIVISFVGPR